MSEHDVTLEATQEAVDELMRKVDVLRAKRPHVHADVVREGVAASIVDPGDASSADANAQLAREYDAA